MQQLFILSRKCALTCPCPSMSGGPSSTPPMPRNLCLPSIADRWCTLTVPDPCLFAQAEHKKTAQDLGNQAKGIATEATPPPPHDNQGPRHRALLTRIFPRHGAALNGRGQRLKWREGRNRVGHRAHISSATPGGLLQRPRRHGQSPQWTDTGGHDGRRAPRTNKAGKSHQPAVSPSRTRSEAGPKRSPPYPGIHHRVHNLIPAPEGCAPR